MKAVISNSTRKIFSQETAETLSSQNWQMEKNNLKKLLRASLNDQRKSKIENVRLQGELRDSKKSCLSGLKRRNIKDQGGRLTAKIEKQDEVFLAPMV